MELLDLESARTRSEAEAVTSQLYRLADLAELDGEEEDRFRAVVARATVGDLNTVQGKMTLVQVSSPDIFILIRTLSVPVQTCAERGLASYLAALLSAGADPNLTTVMRPRAAVLLAAAGGRVAALRALLGHGAVEAGVWDQQYRQTVLHQVIRRPRHDLELAPSTATSQPLDYEGCLELVLGCGKLNLASIINVQDVEGNTALHYATQLWDEATVTRLLLLGANIGLRNARGETPISNILPATMERFLNQHCLKSEGNPTNEDFKISFHYDFLAPPRDSEAADTVQLEEGGRKKEAAQPETDVLWYMARSKDHRHLLKHPVITSFLALKWSRISGHYNANLVFSVVVVLLLTLYIFTNYAGHSLGVVPPPCPANTTAGGDTGQDGGRGNSLALWWAVAGVLGLVAAREALQLSVTPGQYLASAENTLEILMLVLAAVMLGHGAPGCHLAFKREIAASVLLISWILMVTMIGRHPQMSSYNIYSTMFYSVLKTFLSILVWFSLFILAYALSFYILLHEDKDEVPGDYPFFDHVGLAIVKTFSMFVGELEFSDIPLSSPFSYVFFLLFVFLIVVVLMNLLNGLAVSDTGLIREQAEIFAHVSRVEVIAQVEATLLGDPAHLLRGEQMRRLMGSIFNIFDIYSAF